MPLPTETQQIDLGAHSMRKGLVLTIEWESLADFEIASVVIDSEDVAIIDLRVGLADLLHREPDPEKRRYRLAARELRDPAFWQVLPCLLQERITFSITIKALQDTSFRVVLCGKDAA